MSVHRTGQAKGASLSSGVAVRQLTVLCSPHEFTKVYSVASVTRTQDTVARRAERLLCACGRTRFGADA